jgi:hypothetical protein
VRRRPDPYVLQAYALKALLHYHYHTLIGDHGCRWTFAEKGRPVVSSTIPAEDYGGVSAPRFQTRFSVWCVEEVAFADVHATNAQDHVRQHGMADPLQSAPGVIAPTIIAPQQNNS